MKPTISTALQWLDIYIVPPVPSDEAVLSLLAGLQAEELAVVLPSFEFYEWHAALAMPAAVMWRAASPATPPEQRAALVTFLRALASSEITAGGWRTFRGWQDEEFHTGLQFCTGQFTLPEGWELSCEHVLDTRPSQEQIVQFCAALDANGPVEWRPEFAGRLAEATGLSHAEAAYLFAGLPDAMGFNDVDAWLTADTLGLTEVTAEGARSRFNGLSTSACLALLAAAIPPDPTELWTTGPDVASIADECVTRLGQRVPIPEDILASAREELPDWFPFISDIANPDSCTWLHTDAHTATAIQMSVGGFLAEHLVAVTAVMPWLADNLPADSPIRAALPRARDLVSERLRNPHFSCCGEVSSDTVQAFFDLRLEQPT